MQCAMSNTNLTSNVDLTQSTKSETTGETATRSCNQCGTELVVGTNWSAGNLRARKYKCVACCVRNRKAQIDDMPDAEYLHMIAKHRSSKKGTEFTITPEDVAAVDSDVCPYLNIPIKKYARDKASSGQTGCRHQDAKSLDRIDSSKGYVPGNIIVCSWRANRMLSDFTAEELLLAASSFYRILNSTKPTNESQTIN